MRRLMILSAAVCLLAACQVSENDIRKWERQPEGERRITEALKSPEVTTPVKVEGVLALVRMGKVLQLEETFKGMAPPLQKQLVPQVMPELIRMFSGSDAGQQATVKDLLFIFSQSEDETLRAQCTGLLLDWYRSGDLENKYAAGKFSAFTVLTVLGEPGGELALEWLGQKQDRLKAARILEKIGSENLRQRTTGAYVAVLKEEFPKFSQDTLYVLGLVRSTEVSEYLGEFAKAKANDAGVRLEVIKTLRQHPETVSLPVAIAIYRDTTEFSEIRMEAIELIKAVGSDRNVDDVLAGIGFEDLTWQAFDAALKLGGAAALKRAAEALPKAYPYNRREFEMGARFVRALEPAAAGPVLLEMAGSPKVWVRALALFSTRELDIPEKAAIKQRLVSDTEKPGWLDGESLGSLAATLL